MNPWGLRPEELAAAAIIGLVCLVFLSIVLATYVRNGVWFIVMGVLLVIVVLGILSLAKA